MNKFHIALATDNVAATVADYSKRLGQQPCSYIKEHYALWRTDSLNLSVRQDTSCQPGELRHLGWEDSEADEFTMDTDINGIVWERFTAEQQAQEIREFWPESGYEVQP